MNVKEFFATRIAKAKGILMKIKNWAVAGKEDLATEDGGGNPLPRRLVHDWIMAVLMFTLSSVVPVIALSLQGVGVDQTATRFPVSFYLFSMGILLAFNFVFLSKFATQFPNLAWLLEQIAVFLTFTLVFIGMSICFPLWLKCVVWVIYSLSLLPVLAFYFRIYRKGVDI